MPFLDAPHLRLACVLAGIAAPGAGLSADTSLAMVTDVHGTVEIQAETRSPPLAILQELASGTRFRLDHGERVSIVYLDSGQAFEFAGPGEVRLDPEGPRALRGRAPVARGPALAGNGEAVRIEPLAVTQAALVMRSPPRDGKEPRLQLLSLAGTRILEDAPVFRWIAPHAGGEFKLVLFDDRGREIWSQAGNGDHVALPASVVLVQGSSYTWLVSAKDATGRLHTNAGDFSVAPPELRARAAAMRPGSDAPVPTRVVYAAWLKQNGLHDAARPWWQALAGELHDQPRLQALSEE